MQNKASTIYTWHCPCNPTVKRKTPGPGPRTGSPKFAWETLSLLFKEMYHIFFLLPVLSFEGKSTCVYAELISLELLKGNYF